MKVHSSLTQNGHAATRVMRAARTGSAARDAEIPVAVGVLMNNGSIASMQCMKTMDGTLNVRPWILRQKPEMALKNNKKWTDGTPG